MDHPDLFICSFMENSIGPKRVNNIVEPIYEILVLITGINPFQHRDSVNTFANRADSDLAALLRAA